ANLQTDEANPYIIPCHYHLTTLLVRHYHQQLQPMGIVVNTFPTQDGKVRKVEIKVVS
ncbi:hypothetical protein GOODEAATRI_022306, partial [Goodea atripinnis]